MKTISVSVRNVRNSCNVCNVRKVCNVLNSRNVRNSRNDIAQVLRGGGVLPISGMRVCATLDGEFKIMLPYIRVYFSDFAIQKGPLLASKVTYKIVLYSSK